jgi:hypothetical protein
VKWNLNPITCDLNALYIYRNMAECPTKTLYVIKWLHNIHESASAAGNFEVMFILLINV